MQKIFDVLMKEGYLRQNYLPVHPHFRNEFYEFNTRCLILEEMTESEFENIDVPDSKEHILLDIGSHLGVRKTLPFARENPNTNVVMVDKINIHSLERAIMHVEDYLPNKVYISDNVSDTVNKLLDANGFRNVKYIQKELTEDYNKLPIDESKQITITGFRNPKGLGNITIKIAKEKKARKVYLTNSGIEMIHMYGKQFGFMQDYLSKKGFSNEEIINIKEKLSTEKFNYKTEEGRLYADSLKLLFILAQKDYLKDCFDVNISKNKIANEKVRNFNNPSYNIIATTFF